MAPHSGLPDPPTPSPATCSLILSPDPKTEFFKGSQSSKTLACSILCHCMVLHLHFTLSGHRNRQSGVFSSHSVSLPLRCPTPSRLDQLFKHLNRAGPHLPVNWGMNTFTAAPSSTQLLNWKKKTSQEAQAWGLWGPLVIGVGEKLVSHSDRADWLNISCACVHEHQAPAHWRANTEHQAPAHWRANLLRVLREFSGSGSELPTLGLMFSIFSVYNPLQTWKTWIKSVTYETLRTPLLYFNSRDSWMHFRFYLGINLRGWTSSSRTCTQHMSLCCPLRSEVSILTPYNLWCCPVYTFLVLRMMTRVC